MQRVGGEIKHLLRCELLTEEKSFKFCEAGLQRNGKTTCPGRAVEPSEVKWVYNSSRRKQFTVGCVPSGHWSGFAGGFYGARAIQ